jgi:lipoate-protein ligase A
LSLRFAWTVVRESGTAGELHAGSYDAMTSERVVRTVRVLEATRPALVLGSSQPESNFDQRALQRSGLEVVRRRTGGGAVIVGPGRVLWVDFLLPAGDPGWDDDVGRAAWWVGEAWRAALLEVGFTGEEVEVWKGRLVAGTWGSRVCFAGIGPGEVRIAGRKAVGVSQRRTRRAALFQTAAALTWSPEEYVELLADVPVSDAELRDGVTAVGSDLEGGLAAALLNQLSTPAR